MPKIKINGRELEVAEGRTVLQAALENDIYIPHFCYHPHLPIGGNCRMCLVDVRPGPPKLSIACGTTVTEGMEIETENEKVQAARRSVMEFLLKNHPIDCPVCDQAGECTLHEYYMKYGLQSSRLLSIEEKVRKHKAQRLGKNVVLDSERCVLCSRCVRFMREVIGDECLVIAKRSDHSEITTFPGRTVDNPYSLCLTSVCPVGAWTSLDFRFKQRVWFLESAPAVCPGCARGCNIWIDHRKGEVFRIRPRVNDKVNKSWACDEGRLAYKALNRDRLLAPRLKNVEITWETAFKKGAQIMRDGKQNLTVVVSAGLTNEEGGKVLALFRDKMGVKVLLHGGTPGWEDQILRRADQNANTKGLSDLGITERLSGTALPGAWVLIETIGSAPLPAGVPQPALVISPSETPAVMAAEAALPAAGYAESGGTFTNFNGVVQSFGPAFQPKGQSKILMEILAGLARELGY